ncbi:MAG TPA: hypothetical protein VN661_00665 [Candidatus Acidoferrales bacterium]|nr:hypothetical protein [Candidatus Acidoferrales bacterium]
MVRTPCDLDLLLFLRRHPQTLLTSEQLAAFVGYPMKEVAESLDLFIASGLLERIQNPMHAARMYLLNMDHPQGGGPRRLLDVASSRMGRQSAIRALRSERPSNEAKSPRDKTQDKLHLVRIA